MDFLFTLVSIVEIKKAVVAVERVEIVEFSLLQRRLQQEGKLRPNLDFKERGTFPSSVISNDSCKGVPFP